MAITEVRGSSRKTTKPLFSPPCGGIVDHKRYWRRVNWALGRRLAFFSIVIGVVTIASWHINASENDITGAISRAEPTVEQDGSLAHPYADDSQCPPTTDVVIWPKNDRPIPRMPPGISVCF